MLRPWAALAVVALLAAAVSPPARAQLQTPDAYVFEVTPSRGSVEGGTEVAIRGSGFARNGIAGSTTVVIGNTRCDVVEYKSSNEQLVCRTRPFPLTHAQDVRVSIVSTDRAFFAECRGACRYAYDAGRTPVLATFTAGGAPGGLVSLEGHLRGRELGMHEARVDGQLCELVGDPDDVVAERTSSFARLQCRLSPELLAGRHNLTLSVQDADVGFGAARVPAHLVNARAHRAFTFTVHPRVDALSFHASGARGGDTLAITGAGFSPACAENRIDLAGVPCRPTACSPTQLLCLVGPASVAPAAPANSSNATATGGTRGLRLRQWTGRSTYSFEGEPDLETTQGTELVGLGRNVADRYVQELVGLFVPPVTANYSFHAIADDRAEIFLGTDGDPAGQARVVRVDHRTRYFSGQASQSSAPIPLVAGQRYSFRATHQEGSGTDFFQGACRIHGSAADNRSALELTHHSLREQQLVDIDSAVVREQHTLSVLGNGTAGTLRLQLGSRVSTTTVDAAASATGPFRDAVRQLGGRCNSVSVARRTQPLRIDYVVTYHCPTSSPFDLPRLLNVNLRTAAGPLGLEQERTRGASAPVRGSFVLGYEGALTEPLPYFAGAAAVETQLEALPGLVDVTVLRSGNADDGLALTIEVVEPKGDVAPLTVNGSALTGSGVAVAARTLVDGSLDAFFDPCPADFFELALAHPVARVHTSGILAECGSATGAPCRFAYDASRTPVLSAVAVAQQSPGGASPRVGSASDVVAGDTLTLTGTGLLGDDPAVAPTVSLGTARCNVSAFSATRIVCGLGHGAQGESALAVVVPALGLAAGEHHLVYGFRVDTVAQATAGSVQGGTALTLHGTGFSPATAVTVGGKPCTRVAGAPQSASTLVCSTPPAAIAGSVAHQGNGTINATIAVAVANQTLGLATPFQYDWAATPELRSVFPPRIGAGESTLVTLQGDFDAASTGCDRLAVELAGAPCANPFLASPGTLQCVVAQHQPGPARDQTLPVAPAVTLCAAPSGGPVRAYPNPGVAATVAFAVDTVAPAVGSLAGGTLLTIRGTGFSVRAPMQVSLATAGPEPAVVRVPCEIQSANFTTIECRTGPAPANTTAIALQAAVSTVGGVTAACTASCAFAMQGSATPALAALNATSGVAGDAVLVTGLRLGPAARLLLDGRPACAAVLGASATSLLCRLAELPHGNYTASVEVPGLGRAPTTLPFSSRLVVLGLSHTSGSTAGGLTLNISGMGFAPLAAAAGNRVLFGATPAVVLASSYSTLTVVSPAVPPAGDALHVTVQVLPAPPDGARAGTPGTAPEGCSPAPCTFVADPAQTPSLAAASPPTVVAGDTLTLTGADLLPPGGTASASDVTVSISGTSCAVVTATATEVQCTAGGLPAGDHPVVVSVAGLGAALSASPAVRVASALAVTAVSPQTGSHGGGTALTISGRGLGLGPAQTTVTVCGRPCPTTSSSYDRVVCTTPPLATLASLAFFPAAAQPTVLAGDVAAVGTSSAQSAFDLDFETFASGAGGCAVGLDLGAQHRAQVSRLRFVPRRQRLAHVVGAVFEVSADGLVFATVATVQAQPHEGWNAIDVAPSAAVRFVRFRGASDGPCEVAELEFIGVALAAGEVCPVVVEVGPAPAHPSLGPAPAADPAAVAAPASTAAPFSYSTAATPTVTSIAPGSGSALGGTTVTITGTDLAPATNATGTSVVLNGVACDVVSATATRLVCRTRARDAFRVPTVAVSRPGLGLALTAPGAVFRYLDAWSALTTWRFNDLPVAGDTVVIPKGQSVLLDVSPPRLFLLLVQGELVFARRDLALDATYIFVQGGALEVGTEAEPFLQRATITLHGDRLDTVEIPQIGAKVLAVADATHTNLAHGEGHLVRPEDEGRLDIHGRPRRRTWTRLAATARANATALRLAEPVDFEAGDRLVLTSSSRRREEAEELVVAGRSADNRTVLLTAPLAHDHEAAVYRFEAREVDLRCEVGLLSRNVVIQGDAGSDAQLFGAHTIAAHSGLYRVENAELRRCGQAGLLGRYCTHYHMGGTRRGSYIRSNSVHRSFQRATTVHGTNHLRVANNVAYLVRGHTFFVEDGAEAFNVFDANLGVSTLKLFSGIASDSKPATFWTASPKNLWRNNVAAGSVNDGFWLELPGHPHGPSFTNDVCPVHDHLVEFRNNTAHGNGVHGLRIYPQYTPLADPCGGAGTPSAPQFFHNFTSYRNGGNGIFGKLNGDLHHIGASLVENGAADQRWSKFKTVGFRESNPYVVDGLFVASTAPGGRAPGGKVALFGPQDEFWHVGSATFINYGDAGALAACAACDSDQNMKQGGYTYRFEGLRFVNSSRRTRWQPPFKQIFFDLDGSLTGQQHGTACPLWDYNRCPECVEGGPAFDGGLVCNASVRVRRLQVEGVEPRELDFKELSIANARGNRTRVPFRHRDSYGWVPILVTHQPPFAVGFASAIDWRRMRLRYSEPEYVFSPQTSLRNEHLLLALNFTDFRFAYDVVRPAARRRAAGEPVPPLSLLDVFDPAADEMGAGIIDNTANAWTVALTTQFAQADGEAGGGNPFEVEVDAIQCAPGACGLLLGEQPLGPPMAWSNVSNWCRRNGVATYLQRQACGGGEGGGGEGGVLQLPQSGDNVILAGGMYVVLDINPPPLRELTIIGKLHFEDSSSRLLEADNILVWGHLQVGSAARPFAHPARIRLHGVRASPALIVHDSQFLGNKVMGVYGQLDLHGRAPAVPWTRLAETAEAGATTVLLRDPVVVADAEGDVGGGPAASWAVGDEVVLGTTEYDATEVETATVAAVGADGRTLTLAAPLAFRHFAGNVSDGRPGSAGPGLALAAPVGLLTRNVVFEGAEEDPQPNYGGHIVVGEVVFEEGSKAGRTAITGVQLHYCGQQTLEHACIHYQFASHGVDPAEAPPNLLRASALSYALNYGVVSFGSTALRLFDNVLHRTFRSGVDMDEHTRAAVVERNLVVGNFRSPDETLAHVRTHAGFMLNTRVASLRGNVVSGTTDTGFVLRVEECLEGGGAEGATMADNEAVGALIGAFVLSEGSGCRQLTRFTAWKCAHIGVFTVDQTANVVLEDVAVADNHMGISLNFIRGGADNRVEVRNSRILGSTPASTCAASLTCRAQTRGDVVGTACRSVFGTTRRRVGLVAPQYLNAAKTCLHTRLNVCRPPTTPERLCSLPWAKRHGLPSARHAELHLTGTAFAHWNETDCGMSSVAFTHNPSQNELSPRYVVAGASWHRASPAARMMLAQAPNGARECTTACDALHNLIVEDVDGSFSGEGVPSTLFSGANPLLAGGPGSCQFDANRSAFTCPRLNLRNAVLSNLDRDRGRPIGPVRVAREQGGENITAFSVGPFKDPCPIRNHFGQFPFAVEPGLAYDITATATMPNNVRISYFGGGSPAGRVLLRVFYTNPTERVGLVGGQPGRRIVGRRPTLADPVGSYALDPQARRFFLVLGGDGPVDFFIRSTNRVQISLAVSITVNEFFAERIVQNLALLLSIPADRIKVVEVRALEVADAGRRRRALLQDAGAVAAGGASVVVVEVAEPLATSDEQAEQQLDGLADVTAAFAEAAQSGRLLAALAADDIPLLSATVTPPAGQGVSAQPLSFSSADLQPPGSGSGRKGGLTAETIAVAAATGCALVLLLVAAVAVWNQKANQRHKRRVSPQASRARLVSAGSTGSSLAWAAEGEGAAGPRSSKSRLVFLTDDDCISVDDSSPAASRDFIIRDAPACAADGPGAGAVAAGALDGGAPTFEAGAWGTLLRHTWLAPEASAEQTLAFLTAEPVGSFLVYGTPGRLAISQPFGVETYHIESDAGSIPPSFRVVLGHGVRLHSFPSLSALVAYYQRPHPRVPFVLAARTRPFALAGESAV